MILLFDIDGTLLLSGGAGRVAMERTMMKLHGDYREVDIPVHGRTDRAIVADLLEAHEIASDEPAIADFYADYVNELELAMDECAGTLLPGVMNLLTHLSMFNGAIHMGILTGNGRLASDIKLNYFGIGMDRLFHFGGFGETTPCRNQIAANALSAARKHLDTEPDLNRTWVIGDTIHDVSCARSIGARALAVGTGNVDKTELQASRPDVYLENLADIDRFMESIEFEHNPA